MLVGLLKKGLDFAVDKLIEYEYVVPETIQYTSFEENNKVNCGIVEKSSSDVEIKAGQILEMHRETKTISNEEKFFEEIDGYNDIKRIIMRGIGSPEPTHVILDGPPASGKTIFLLSM